MVCILSMIYYTWYVHDLRDGQLVRILFRVVQATECHYTKSIHVIGYMYTECCRTIMATYIMYLLIFLHTFTLFLCHVFLLLFKRIFTDNICYHLIANVFNCNLR